MDALKDINIDTLDSDIVKAMMSATPMNKNLALAMVYALIGRTVSEVGAERIKLRDEVQSLNAALLENHGKTICPQCNRHNQSRKCPDCSSTLHERDGHYCSDGEWK